APPVLHSFPTRRSSDLALDWWLFFAHGIAQGLRHLINEPAFFLIVFALVVLSAALHECGHATACRYGGAHPGVMGVGIYLVWPRSEEHTSELQSRFDLV